MITASKSGCRSVPALAAFVVCCLASPAIGDEYQYLPNNARVIASVNVTTGAKTKTFKEFMKAMAALAPKANEQEEFLANFTSKIGRLTLGVGMTETDVDEVEILTAVKSITVDEYKALKKASPFQDNYAWKEIKHGSVTIYQPTWKNKFDKSDEPKVIEGEAFYLAEGKYIVSSKKVELLKTIIDRKKPATLSPAMQAGLKDASFTNTVAVVVDIQNMPAKEKEKLPMMFAGFAMSADIKANIGKVQSLTVKVNEPGKVKLTATLTCNDKATVDVVKTMGEKSLADLKTKANADPKQKIAPEFVKYVTAARTTINAIEVTSAGTKVTASAEVDSETAVNAVMGFLVVFSRSDAPRPPEVKDNDLPKKAPGK